MNKDWLSKSDPIVVLMEKKSRDQPGWTFIGRTEPVKNDLNPSFHEKIFIVVSRPRPATPNS